GVPLVVPEMPLVEPLDSRAEVDLSPVLVVGLLDFRQDPLEVRSCRIHERVPEHPRNGAQIAQVEVLSMDREAECTEMIDEFEDRGASLRINLCVCGEGRAARVEALFRPVNADP